MEIIYCCPSCQHTWDIPPKERRRGLAGIVEDMICPKCGDDSIKRNLANDEEE